MATITAEAAVGVGILLITALLVEQVPARQAGAASQPAREQSVSRVVDDLVMSVSGAPNLVGPNGLTLLVGSRLRPEPAPITAVDVVVRSPGGIATTAMTHTGPGQWYATVSLPDATDLTLTTVVTRAGRQVSFTTPWSVTAPRRVAPAEGDLAGYTRWLATGVIIVGAAVVWWMKRRRRTDDEPAQDGIRAVTTSVP